MDLTLIGPTGYKKALLAKNRVEKNMDAADLQIVDRSKIRYFLSLLIPPYFNAAFDDWEELPYMEAVEEPITHIGETIQAKGAFFSIGNILKSLVNNERPGFNQTEILPLPEMVMPFRIKTVVKNNGVQIGDETIGGLEYAIAAGISELEFETWGDTFIQKYIGEGRRFLSYSPVTKLLYDQKAYLYFLNNLQPSAIGLKLRAYRWYTDGTSDAAPYTIMVQPAVDMVVYSIPVSPELVCGDTSGKTVARYAVWLVNDGNMVISEIKHYEIDFGEYQDTRCIIFRNSLGGYDSMCFGGWVAETIHTVRDVFEKVKPAGKGGSFSERVVSKVTGERELTLNTSWISEAERLWLSELAFSEDVLLVTKKGFIPMILTDETYTSDATEERLIGRTFVFRYSETETSFSNLPVKTVSLRATGWRGYGSIICELDGFGKRNGFGKYSHLEMYYKDDNSIVKPSTIKLNIEGTEGYIPPLPSLQCNITPYLNAEYTAMGSFVRNNCGNGSFGNKPIISVPAGRWGSIVSQADANEKALIEWYSLDTQETANKNGTCTILNQNGIRAKFYTYYPNGTDLPPAEIFNTAPGLTTVLNSFKINYLVLEGLNFQQDYFAIRMTGLVKAPVSGQMNLYVFSDDGARVWWNGVQIVDDWMTHSAAEKVIPLTVEQNKFYPIMVEYFEFAGGEQLSLSWSWAGQAQVEIPSNALFYE